MWLRRKELHLTKAWVDPIHGSCYFARTLPRLRDLRVGVRALGAAGLLAAAVSGCGPLEYLNQVGGKAARAVADAKAAGAERHAPYEYTSAVEYLHKAREEAGYAEYQVAIDYGRRAEEFALRAQALAEEKSRSGAATELPAAPGRAPSAAVGDSP